MHKKKVIKLKKVRKRKNPMTANYDNIRRWAYLNFPKYDIETRKYVDSWIDSGIVSDFSKYFNVNFNRGYILLGPYANLWTWIQNEKWTKNKKSEVWRQYLIDEPELFEAMYL